ncbi:hypothetical protein [Desulfolithobacter sp.]
MPEDVGLFLATAEPDIGFDAEGLMLIRKDYGWLSVPESAGARPEDGKAALGSPDTLVIFFLLVIHLTQFQGFNGKAQVSELNRDRFFFPLFNCLEGLSLCANSGWFHN